MNSKMLILCVMAMFCFPGCATEEPPQTLISLESPAGPASGEPGFTEIDGDLVLSWVQGDESGHRLLYSTLTEGGTFGEPQEVARGTEWFVNWADRPSVVGGEGDLVGAHWLAKSDSATYAYDVWTQISTDKGASWSAPVRAHTDGTETEHGFASLIPEPDGFRMVWLDGRETGSSGGHGLPGGAMTLRSAHLGADGKVSGGVLLDGRVCDCCPTASVSQAGIHVVAYRDRSESEIRDIYFTRYAQGTWSNGKPVHGDNWEIHGCPVNGPALAATDEQIACLWFTSPETVRQVKVAVSSDGGQSFGTPVRVDGGSPIGRVDVEAIEGGLFVLLWMEEAPAEVDVEAQEDAAPAKALVQARVLFPNGDLGKTVTLVITEDTRSAGFPRIALSGKNFYITWTEPGEVNQVKVVRWSPEWIRS